MRQEGLTDDKKIHHLHAVDKAMAELVNVLQWLGRTGAVFLSFCFLCVHEGILLVFDICASYFVLQFVKHKSTGARKWPLYIVVWQQFEERGLDCPKCSASV